MVLDLICGLSPSLALILAKVCPDSLLAGGMACREIDQFSHHPWLVASQLIDKGLISCARDERSQSHLVPCL